MHDDIEAIFGPLESAIYSTVARFVDPATGARGATALAPRIGMVAGVLSNKANPAQDHQLTLRESIAIQLAAHDYPILHAYARALGHTAYPLPPADDCSDVALLETYCNLHSRIGQLADHLRESLADQRVTRAEVETVKAAFDKMVRAGLGLVSRIDALSR